MRPVLAVPLFVFAFMLGFNMFGAFLMVKSRVKQAMAVSTTTITSAPVEK